MIIRQHVTLSPFKFKKKVHVLYNNNNICLFQTHKIGTAYICVVCSLNMCNQLIFALFTVIF